MIDDIFNPKFVFLKKKDQLMNKNQNKECKCIHCQQKLEQISNARSYWDKLISRKTEIMNNLFLEKEVIENQIESLKYDLNYYEIQKSNLKVYTLSKYKELFSNNLDNIENVKFNGLSSIKIIDNTSTTLIGKS